MRILKVQFCGSHFLTSLLVGDLSEFGKRNSIVWSVLCLKPELCGPSEVEWQGELFIVSDLQSWVQLGTFTSKLLVHGTLQSRAVGLGSGAASSSSWKYFFQKSPEALLLRPAEDMCSPSTCQGKGTVGISGVWLGGCPCCMFYLVQDIRWHPSWKEAGGSMEGSKVFWKPGGLRYCDHFILVTLSAGLTVCFCVGMCVTHVSNLFP